MNMNDFLNLFDSAGSKEADMPYFSDMALSKYRIKVEVAWLEELIKGHELSSEVLSQINDSKTAIKILENINESFDQEQERTKTFKSDENKATRYFISKYLDRNGLGALSPYVQYGLSDEIFDSFVYGLAMEKALADWRKTSKLLYEQLKRLSQRWSHINIISSGKGVTYKLDEDFDRMASQFHEISQNVDAPQLYGVFHDNAVLCLLDKIFPNYHSSITHMICQSDLNTEMAETVSYEWLTVILNNLAESALYNSSILCYVAECIREKVVYVSPNDDMPTKDKPIPKYLTFDDAGLFGTDRLFALLSDRIKDGKYHKADLSTMKDIGLSIDSSIDEMEYTIMMLSHLELGCLDSGCDDFIEE